MLIYKFFRNVRIEIRGFDETQKVFVDDLQMRPSKFEYWLIFLQKCYYFCKK
jgi:hypothetical protein